MKTAKLFSKSRQALVLKQIEDRRKLLQDQVKAVAQGYTSALFVFGPGGLGKTHHITSQLDALCGKSWVHHTAYSTPKALMLSIASFPENIHLFEDCEKLYKTDVAASLLRAACGSPRQKERWITYETAHETLRVLFKGGIIIVSNEDIGRTRGPLAAVASRFRPVQWNLTVEERAVSILSIAQEGWRKGQWMLEPSDCQEVADFLVDEMIQGKVTVPVDIRTYVEHALPAFAQWKAGATSRDWREIILTKLQGSLLVEERRSDKSARLEALALGLAQNSALDRGAKMKKWKEETGLGQAIFYRHLKKAKGSSRLK